MVYTCHWGIIGPGQISTSFVEDLLVDPKTRNVEDVIHIPVAVASRSLDRAQEFVDKVMPHLKDTTKVYGSYEEIVHDKNVDVLYIGTTQSTHYNTVLLALRAGKHVLCEKPFTINAAQAKHLQIVAQEHNLFLMEAVWTRFFPLMHAFEQMLHVDKVIGEIRRVATDFSISVGSDSRLYNAQTGGGSLLDLGLYALLWIFITCYKHPSNALTPPDVIKTISIQSPTAAVDENTAIIMLWNKINVISLSTTSLVIPSPPGPPVVRVEGELGNIIIPQHPSRPEKIILQLKGQEERVIEFPIPGHGLFWEADAVARDLRDGKTSESLCPLEQSVMSMEWMDETRSQNNFVFPADIEFVENY